MSESLHWKPIEGVWSKPYLLSDGNTTATTASERRAVEGSCEWAKYADVPNDEDRKEIHGVYIIRLSESVDDDNFPDGRTIYIGQGEILERVWFWMHYYLGEKMGKGLESDRKKTLYFKHWWIKNGKPPYEAIVQRREFDHKDSEKTLMWICGEKTTWNKNWSKKDLTNIQWPPV